MRARSMYASQLQTDCATARASPRLSEYATTAKSFSAFGLVILEGTPFKQDFVNRNSLTRNDSDALLIMTGLMKLKLSINSDLDD